MSCSRFWRSNDSGLESLQEIRWLFEARPAYNLLCREKVLLSRAARGYMSWRDEQRSRRRGDSKLLED